MLYIFAACLLLLVCADAQQTIGPTKAASLSVSKEMLDCQQFGVGSIVSVDDGLGINNCIASAKAGGYGGIKMPTGSLHIVTAINAVNLTGMTIAGSGSDFYGYTSTANITELRCDTGTVCLDAAGGRAMKYQDFSMRIANTYSTPSNVAVIEGRTGSAGGSCYSEDIVWDRVPIWTDHSTINATRGYIGIYNVGGEVRKYTSGYISADTPAMFMTTNVLTLSSPYETLGSGCPQSMTNVQISDTTFRSTYGNGIESWTTADVTMHGAVFLMASGTNGRFVMPISFFGAYATNWHVDGHVEALGQNNSLMSWGATTMQANTFTFNLGGSTQAGDTHGYIAWPSAGFAVGENTVVLDLHNEPAGFERPFFSNASAENINGGTYVFTGSLKGTSMSNITLNGTKIIAPDFTPTQVAFNAASNYNLLHSSGWLQVGALQLSSAITQANGADATLPNTIKCGLTSDQACQINFLDKTGATIGILQKTAGNAITLSRGTSSFLLSPGQTGIEDTTAAGITFNDTANTSGIARFFGGGASPVERVRVTDSGLKADLTNGAFIKSTLSPAPTTLTYTAIAAQTCQEQPLTVTGATAGKPAFFSPSATLGNVNLHWSSWVSATNTVSVKVCNVSAGSLTPAAVAWNGWVLQ